MLNNSSLLQHNDHHSYLYFRATHLLAEQTVWISQYWQYHFYLELFSNSCFSCFCTKQLAGGSTKLNEPNLGVNCTTVWQFMSNVKLLFSRALGQFFLLFAFRYVAASVLVFGSEIAGSSTESTEFFMGIEQGIIWGSSVFGSAMFDQRAEKWNGQSNWLHTLSFLQDFCLLICCATVW